MGGVCMAPNICLCPHGYSGKNCEIGKFTHNHKEIIIVDLAVSRNLVTSIYSNFVCIIVIQP